MDFKEWLEFMGCRVEVTQEDDGSGYICLEVTTPSGVVSEITVNV
jgi:hypothetical protein